MAKAIFSLMKSAIADCQTAIETNGRIEAADIMDILSKQGLIVLSQMMGHTHTVATRQAMCSTTTVDVDFEFHAPDGSCMNSRATGVLIGQHEHLSNALLDQARGKALESAFSLTTLSLLMQTYLSAGAVGKAVAMLAPSSGEGIIQHRAPDVVAVAEVEQTVGKGKAAVNKIMAQAGLPALVTADEVALPSSLPKTPTLPPATDPVLPVKSALNPDAQALKEWKAKVETLDADNPGDWDEHAQALGKLKGLKDGQHRELFIAFREYAQKKQVGYDPFLKRFFLITQAA